MKTNLLGIALLVCLAVGCSKSQFIKTGTSNGRFDGSMLEYMEAHSYDWDSTVLMVYRAGDEMIQLFEGQNPDYPEITFFGPTNHSIRRYMLRNNIARVEDMTPEFCEDILKRHVIAGKMWRDSIPRGIASQTNALIGTGGQTYTTLAGTDIWVFSYALEWQGVEGAGAVVLYVTSLDKQIKNIDVASTNIEPDNGLVHSLSYDFTLGEL